MKRVFVHKYKHSHEGRRKRYRKLLKNKKVKLIERTRDGFLYEEVKNELC